MTSPYTPGLGGYVLGILVSWCAFLVPLVLFVGAFVVYAVPFVAVVGTPVGAVGALATHLACRNAPDQAVHVLVAGLTGAALMVPIAAWAEGEDPVVGLVLSLWVGVAAAVGRASVIGLVPERQANRDPQ